MNTTQHGAAGKNGVAPNSPNTASTTPRRNDPEVLSPDADTTAKGPAGKQDAGAESSAETGNHPHVNAVEDSSAVNARQDAASDGMSREEIAAVRRATLTLADPANLSVLSPLLTEGIDLDGPITAIGDHHTDIPLNLARLAFFEDSAQEANRQLREALEVAAGEVRLREQFRQIRRDQILAECREIGAEAEVLRREQKTYTQTIETNLGTLGLALPSEMTGGSGGVTLAVVTTEWVDAAVLRQASLTVGTPGFLPKAFITPALKRMGKGSGTPADFMVKWVYPGLFALPMGLSLGMNLHLFDARALADPGETLTALILSYLIGLACETIYGGFASYQGNREKKGHETDPDPTRDRRFADFLFYFAFGALVLSEAAALWRISLESGDRDNPLPFILFLIIGGLLNAVYVGFRIQQAAHERRLLRAIHDIRQGEAFQGLLTAAGMLQRTMAQLRQIGIRQEELAALHEVEIAPRLTDKVTTLVAQHELEARVERDIAENEMNRIIDAKESLYSAWTIQGVQERLPRREPRQPRKGRQSRTN